MINKNGAAAAHMCAKHSMRCGGTCPSCAVRLRRLLQTADRGLLHGLHRGIAPAGERALMGGAPPACHAYPATITHTHHTHTSHHTTTPPRVHHTATTRTRARARTRAATTRTRVDGPVPPSLAEHRAARACAPLLTSPPPPAHLAQALSDAAAGQDSQRIVHSDEAAEREAAAQREPLCVCVGNLGDSGAMLLRDGPSCPHPPRAALSSLLQRRLLPVSLQLLLEGSAFT